MSEERRYTSRRQAIVEALVAEVKKVNGTGQYVSDVDNNVEPRLLFWDEIEQYPAVHFSAGRETREYQGGGYKDRFLSVTARVYVNEEDSQNALWLLVEDLETLFEQNSRLVYSDHRGKQETTQQITIVGIDTDEGVLEPLGVAEIFLEVRY